jgi:hypothetical protein
MGIRIAESPNHRADPVQARRAPRRWYRDPLGCLHLTIATVLAERGVEPLDPLGAGWGFQYLPGHVRAEEFYYPSAECDLGPALAPHHPLRAVWSATPDGEDPLSTFIDTIAAGGLVIAAVDKHHLPFRPAYHDVHAAHLVVVYGVDRARGLVWVSDSQPPAFSGAVRVEDFLAAHASANPADEQDAFFSDSTIARRYLTVELAEPFPELDESGLAAALRANVAGFLATGDEKTWTGLSGVRRYIDSLVDASSAGEQTPLRQAYTFGWSMQATAYLHSELLRLRGLQWQRPSLREAARGVQAVATAWTPVRVTAAHGWPDPRAAADALSRHGTRLVSRYEEALDAVAALGES